MKPPLPVFFNKSAATGLTLIGTGMTQTALTDHEARVNTSAWLSPFGLLGILLQPSLGGKHYPQRSQWRDSKLKLKLMVRFTIN